MFSRHEARKPHLEYELIAERPLIEKVVPTRGGSISRALARPRPLESGVDALLRQKFHNTPNNEVWQAYRNYWLNFAVRVVAEPLDRPKHIDTITEESFTPVKRKELPSGVTKLSTKVEGKKVTSFIAPPDVVPYSLRTMDILLNNGQDVAVSASLRHIAKSVKRDSDFPAIQMTAAGWNNMILFSDAVYVRPLDEKPVEQHVRRHIRDTMISVDARSDSDYFTVDDFFDVLNNPRAGDQGTKSPLLPGRDAHWLVTSKDGSMQVMSLEDLRTAGTDKETFKHTVASITSTVGYVNETISQEPLQKDAMVQLVNALILFEHEGQQRIGSIHAKFDTNALAMFALAKHIIADQFERAENIALCVVDGGGSSGAIVQKKKNWQTAKKNKFETSTLPVWPLAHEVPIYTAFLPAKEVRRRHTR